MSTSPLQSCSYNAEKLFRKKNGRFDIVLYITEDAHGRRQFLEVACQAPDDVSDRQLMHALADELRDDFAAAGVVRFAIAFIGSKITKLHRIDPPTEDVMLNTSGIVSEVHDCDGTHVRRFREIVVRPGEAPLLLAISEFDSADEGIYAGVLNTVPAAAAAE